MTAKIHLAATAVVGTLVCLLATGQEPNGSAAERGAVPPLALARENPSKSTAEPKGAPVRSPPAAASAPKTVAERKAETLESMRKREMVPAGHGSPAPFP